MYRAAVIGLGRMGSTYDDEVQRGGSVFLPYAHAPSYVAKPGVELVAGADPHDEQRTLFGKRWDIDANHLYADYREMLEAESLDIVSVCTSTRHRARIVEDVARSGVRAIWAEKPIAVTLEEADAMVDVCQREGVALAINCARRWNPFFYRTRQMIEAGELGEILQVTAYAQCGLSHNGSHMIDTVRFLAGGEVSWLWGEIAGDGDLDKGDPMGNGYLAFDNGVRAFIRGMPSGVANWEFDVIGEKGRIRSLANSAEMELFQPSPDALRHAPPSRTPFPWPVRIEGTGIAVLEDLFEAIETGRPPRCSGEDGRAALEIAVALRESHRQGGGRIDIPLTDRSLGITAADLVHDGLPARIRRQRG